ncbi:hypothetical protein Bpfe_015316, partial [Biomphalaria pfeifferi]
HHWLSTRRAVQPSSEVIIGSQHEEQSNLRLRSSLALDAKSSPTFVCSHHWLSTRGAVQPSSEVIIGSRHREQFNLRLRSSLALERYHKMYNVHRDLQCSFGIYALAHLRSS